MTHSEFLAGVGLLQGGIGRAFPDEQLEAWWMCLRDLGADAFRFAVMRWLQVHESGFPSIAAVRRLADEGRNCQQLAAGDAWESVLLAVRRFGYYDRERGLLTLDALTRKALESSGGWNWVCDVNVENRTAMAAQFRGHYETIANRERTERQVQPEVRTVSANTTAISLPGVVDRLTDSQPKTGDAT